VWGCVCGRGGCVCVWGGCNQMMFLGFAGSKTEGTPNGENADPNDDRSPVRLLGNGVYSLSLAIWLPLENDEKGLRAKTYL
jgi:hypothetical protein